MTVPASGTPAGGTRRVLHFVTGGFSGATQVAVELCLSQQKAGRLQPILVLRQKRTTDPAKVQALRDQDFYKSPGVAETIDWATALSELDARSLTPQVVGDTLGALLKYQDDIARMKGSEAERLLNEVKAEIATP